MALLDLADANMLAVRRVTAAIQDFITRAWWAQTQYHDPADFIAMVVPAILGAQIQVAALTDAYLSSLIGEMTGVHTTPVALAPAEVSDLRAGATLAQAYERPFHQLWYAQSQGMDFPDALRSGLERAQSMAAIDMQLAKTHASALVMQQHDNIQRYQRVLSGTENCDLCVTASKHIYKVANLMPIHGGSGKSPGCDCTVAPVIEGRPPLANRINEQRSTPSHSDQEDRVPDKDPAKFVGVEANNELGPVLVARQASYPNYSLRPDGTWEYKGRISREDAAVAMFGEKGAADRLMAEASKDALSGA